MVKKIIVVALSFALVALLAFMAWLYFQRKNTLSIDIPANTSSLLIVNIEKLTRKVMLDTDFKRDRIPKNTGLVIPFKGIAVTTESLPMEVFLIKIPIRQASDFKLFLTQHFTANQNLFRHKEMSISCIHDERFAVFATTKNPNVDVIKTMTDWLQQNNVVSFTKSKFRELNELENDLVWKTNSKTGYADFENGSIKGNFEINKIPTDDSMLSLPGDADAALYYAGNNDAFLNFLFQKSGQRSNSVKGLSAYLKSEKMQEIRAASYEYDDNFEKIKVDKTVQEHVPYFMIHAYAGHLASKSTDTLLGGFLANVKSNDSATIWSNFDSFSMDFNQKKEPVTSPFLMWIDFDKVAERNYVAPFAKYLKPLQKFDAKVKDTNSTSAYFTLYFDDMNENALVQILRLF